MTRRPLIAEIFMRPLYPLLLGASLWILLRGHNAPGGGFIGGLIAVAATAALALVRGAEHARRRMPLDPLRLSGAGVLLALISGLPTLLQGAPFLTHRWLSLPLGTGSLPLSTVMLFDLGVYLGVWGALGGFCLGITDITRRES